MYSLAMAFSVTSLLTFCSELPISRDEIRQRILPAIQAQAQWDVELEQNHRRDEHNDVLAPDRVRPLYFDAPPVMPGRLLR